MAGSVSDSRCAAAACRAQASCVYEHAGKHASKQAGHACACLNKGGQEGKQLRPPLPQPASGTQPAAPVWQFSTHLVAQALHQQVQPQAVLEESNVGVGARLRTAMGVRASC